LNTSRQWLISVIASIGTLSSHADVASIWRLAAPLAMVAAVIDATKSYGGGAWVVMPMASNGRR
jgi:hypothetical protein